MHSILWQLRETDTMMDRAPPGIRIIRARERSLPEINRLIERSKAHWNWPDGYLAQALPLHWLAPAYLQRNHCFEVLAARDELVGFFAVAASGARIMLDNLWVAPEWICRGIGRQACEHVFRLARDQAWPEIWVLPDPPAEGFYRKVGFVDTDERAPSRIPGEPVFSVYRVRLLFAVMD